MLADDDDDGDDDDVMMMMVMMMIVMLCVYTMYSSGIIFLFHLLFSDIYTFAEENTTDNNNDKIWTVYYPYQFDRSQYCHTLRCSADELCVVNVKTARCVKNDKLHDIDGVHIDFASGKPIHHYDEEISHYRAGRIKSQHNHEHLPRHYEHAETINYECDEKKLHSVGGRLLQWFSEMHKLATADSGLPLHST
ncbi:Testican-3 [Dirofilaria immitis]|nr:Testican-3 [Dirofilaria immitis]